MKDIGKFTGNLFCVLAGLSVLSMPFAWFFRQGMGMELSWIIFLWLGMGLRRHRNVVRLITIGINLLGVVAMPLVLIAFALGWIEITEPSLQLFAYKVAEPSIFLMGAFFVVQSGLQVALIVLLLSKKAKAEFISEMVGVDASAIC